MIDLKKNVAEVFEASYIALRGNNDIESGTWRMFTYAEKFTGNSVVPKYGARVFITDWKLEDKVIISGFDCTFNSSSEKDAYDIDMKSTEWQQECTNLETIIKYFSDGYVKDKDVELSFFNPKATGSVRLVEIEGKVYYFYFKNTLPRLLQIDRICHELEIENQDMVFKLSLHAVEAYAG